MVLVNPITCNNNHHNKETAEGSYVGEEQSCIDHNYVEAKSWDQIEFT